STGSTVSRERMRRMRSTIVILLIFVISLVNSFQTLPTNTRVKRQLYGYGLGYPSGYVYGNPYTFATYRGLGPNGLYGTGLYGNGLYGNGLYGGGLYGSGLYGGYGLGLGLLGLPYGGLYGR
ncbi:hypothetical protein V3C99_006965, partial [Haemonchus contortus]